MKAVKYSVPAKYSVRDKIRLGFLEKTGSVSQETVDNTVLFLETAAKRKGMEHKLVRNVCLHDWSKRKDVKSQEKFPEVQARYYDTLRQLNESYKIHLV